MKPLNAFKGKLKVLFTDLDDTLTTEGRLPPESYDMLWSLSNQGLSVIPVTGRPAGWCEMMARMWPVLGVIGENGALAFQYKNQKMTRLFSLGEDQRLENQKKLELIEQEILQRIPRAALASDQFCRLFDLAIDFCEDISPLPEKEILQILSIFKKHGATAKRSSIHINGWFGDYDKKSMCELFYHSHFGRKLSTDLEHCGFVGDSPNDEPLFSFFPNSFAVSNLMEFKTQLQTFPQFITPSPGGKGFVELGKTLLEGRGSQHFA